MNELNLLLLSSEAALTYEALLALAAVLILGLFAGRWFERIKLPHITGYITMGVVIGLILVLINKGDLMHHLEIISSIALGFIAFGIGQELEFGKLKKSGKEVVVITLIQAIAAALFTSLGLLVFGVSLPIALVLGAVATATAPAPIMLLTRKYRAEGPLTDTLLPLVGMDDAVGIVLFGVLLSIANALNNAAELTVIEMIDGPAFELVFSLILGAIVGYVTALIIRFVKSSDSGKEEVFLGASLTAVMITVAISRMGLHIGDFPIHLSPILTPMMMGVVLTNSVSRVKAHEITMTVERFTGPILIAFFTLAGAELVVAFSNNTDIRYLSIIGTTVVYIVFRTIGKVTGSSFGAKIMKSHPNVRKYLGITLLPQAGVALGMAYQAKTDFGEDGNTILIVVLIATLIYELFGPIGVKYSLEKSGEIHTKI
jgi:Kef-type K+ transport system membrane component KefB